MKKLISKNERIFIAGGNGMAGSAIKRSLLKFGYGRGIDHASEDIRNKKINRETGIKLVKKYDRALISDYFVKDFIKYIKISKNEFNKTLKKYKNLNFWKQTKKLIPKVDFNEN